MSYCIYTVRRARAEGRCGMIAYICKYAPIEIIEAFGTPAVIMEPHVSNFTQADTLMHPNMCSYVKAVLEEFENGDWEGMLFTTCCDSSRRLCDTLCRLHPDKFFFCFDLPRKVNDFAVSLYEEQMEKLIEEYGAFSGKTFDAEQLKQICADKIAMRERKEEHKQECNQECPQAAAGLNVCLAGARPGSEVKQLIEDLGAHIALDLTCTGIAREYEIDTGTAEDADGGVRWGGAGEGVRWGGDGESSSSDSDSFQKTVLTSYAAALLGQIPCMRMAQVDGRAEALLAEAEGIDGILYHTVKFCDIYSYEYTRFRQTIDLPIVKLETDATSQCAGQIRTRVEAFLESLRARKKSTSGVGTASSESGEPHASLSECTVCTDYDAGEPRLSMEDVEADRAGRKIQGGTPMYIMGIDSGSTSTNAVIINEKKEILSYAVLRTGAKSADSADRIRAEVLERAGLSPEDITHTVSTGYGRVSIPFADMNVTEISCHGRGAHFLNPAVRTVLDIGGQDSKAIKVNENGDVVDFVMNDKCAAGTGRFLEMMADTLEVGIEELGPLSLKSKENVEISSMCSVFAESEVISLIAQNKEPADIARGIHRAIAGKAMSLLRKVGLEREFMMTGGVAKNPGMVAVLEEMLDAPLYIYDEPEIVGALGAALYGLEN